MTVLRRNSITEDDFTPFDEGWDAYLEGVHKIDNPYPINNWKHYEWNKGWDEALSTNP